MAKGLFVTATGTDIGKTYVTKWIREEGWSVTKKNGNETVLCPSCKRKKKGTKTL